MTDTFRNISARLAMAAAMLMACAAPAMAADAELQHLLAPSGKFRVGLYPGTPTSILESKTEGPRGVGYDLGKALAARIGVPYEPVVFTKNAEVLDAVKTGNVDAAFTNASASRAREMDFGPFYLESELGYLAAPGSALATAADVNVKGVRVGVTAGSSSDAELSRDLTNVEIVRVPAITQVPGLMATGKLDVFATNKATLFELAEQAPGAKVLDGHWGYERHAIAIPKGRDAGIAFVRQFTEDAKAKGLVDAAITRAGLRAAVTAPAAK
jgi:polar amino acid transport system substrate-binding protein